MKKLIFFPAMLLFVLSVAGQSYESVKNLVILNQLKKAKDELDKNWSNAKYTSKAEAHILKTTIYATMALDNAVKGTPEGLKLITDAEAAFDKYREMDQSLVLLKDLIYQNGPINLYAAAFAAGYKDYENKKWAEGLEKFRKVVELSDLLIKEKIINIASIDTNSLLLAGIMAENSKASDEAAKYYTRIADAKIGGADYEGIYRYLVRYYFTKKDMTSFNKYKAIGAQLYPSSDFFKFDQVDFAVGLEEDFNKKLQGLRDALATDPKNGKAWELMGELIYDTIHPRKDDVQGLNSPDLEKEMVEALKKAGETDPESELSFLYLGQHYILRSGPIAEKRDDFIREMGLHAKPGAQPAKADQAKLDAMDKEYAPYLEGARDPFEKAAAIFAKRTSLSPADKLQYKKIIGYLADIYAFKKTQSKNNPADLAKYAAEEKKWNELYDTIK